MADENAHNPESTPDPAREGGDPANANSERLAALEAEVAEGKDRLLRAHAEMENLRRRTAREVSDGRQYAISAFARELVGVADNLNRAIEALPAEQRHQFEGALSALIQGVEVTERELQRVLAKHGVKSIEAAGKKFDPNLHQAVFEVEDPSVPVGTVVKVLQPGYLIGERVLRPAMVSVAKGGPKAESAPAAKPPEEAGPIEPMDNSQA